MQMSIRLKDLFKIKSKLTKGYEREKLKDAKLTDEWEKDNPEPPVNNETEWGSFFSQLHHSMEKLRVIVEGHTEVDYRYGRLLSLLDDLNEDFIGKHDMVNLDKELYELYTQLKGK